MSKNKEKKTFLNPDGTADAFSDMHGLFYFFSSAFNNLIFEIFCNWMSHIEHSPGDLGSISMANFCFYTNFSSKEQSLQITTSELLLLHKTFI